MIMKTGTRFALLTALAVALVLATVGTAFAGGVLFPRAFGEVGFSLDGARSTAEFDARAIGTPALGEDHAAAVGKFKFETKGLKYVAVVDKIHVHAAGEVHFGGQITKSTNPTPVGQFLHVKVVDGGSPGRNGDMISIVISPTDMHEHGTPVAVARGNLVVRTP